MSSGIKLDQETQDKLIRDQLIYKDNQLRVVMKKYLEITAPAENLSEERLQSLIQEFNREVNIYEFQIAKAARQMESQKYDRQQNTELKDTIVQRSKQTEQQIDQLKKTYSLEEVVKNNKLNFEQLATQIVQFDDLQTATKKIEQATLEIEDLKSRHKKSVKAIKHKEKQLTHMLHLMKDLIEEAH